MNYWSDLFTPETDEGYSRSDLTISGFRQSLRTMAEKVKPGGRFICYMVRMSRWIGVLEVLGGPFTDDSPNFVHESDPFVVRLKVNSIVWLPANRTIPIRDDDVFSRLTFTRETGPGGYRQGAIRRSLIRMESEDSEFLTSLLKQKAASTSSQTKIFIRS